MTTSIQVARCGVALALGIAVCSAPRDARAQVGDAAYADIRTVIEELITKEVSEQVAPGIACLSGRTNAAKGAPYSVTYEYELDDKALSKTVHLEAATHFPKTLQRVYNRQYGTLRNIIQTESAGLAGYVVHRALAQLTKGAIDPAALAVVEKSSLACPSDPKKIDVQQQAARAKAPCSAEAESKPSEPGPTGPDFSAVSAEELAACKDAARTHFEDGDWARRVSYPLDEACKTESFECDVAFAVRSALSGQAAVAQDNLIKATALVVRQLAEKVYKDPKVLDIIQRQVVFLLRQQLSSDSWEPKPLLQRLAVSLKAAANVDLQRLNEQELGQVLQQLSQVAGGAKLPEDQQQLLTEALAKAHAGGAAADQAALAKLTALFLKLEQVHAAWRSAADVAAGKLDVGAFVKTLLGPDGALSGFCPTDGAKLEVGADTLACKVIGGLSGSLSVDPKLLVAIADLEPILSHASKAEYTEAAQLAIGYVFQLASRNNPSWEIAVYQRFAKSVATYVLEAKDDDAPSEAARVAFRSAAVDMIQHLGQGGGLRRGLFDNGYNWLLPDLALRASWSASYINPDNEAARIQASANWLNLRIRARRTAATYVGFEASLVDPLAPLSELVLRDRSTSHYHNENTAWANLFSPRVEVLAASPALSEHLALSAGLSLRMAAPILNKDTTAQYSDGNHYDYTLLWNAEDKDGDSLWYRYLEFGFAVKYVL